MPPESTTNPSNPVTAARGRLWARWGFDPAWGRVDGIYAEWEEGNFTRVEHSPAPPHGLPAAACFGEHLLTPGLLNAHAHLDYSFLKGALPRGQGFVPWLRAMVQARRAMRLEDLPDQYEAARRAVRELLESGVTTVWDISSFGWARQGLMESGLRAISFEEWLAPRAAHWEPAWDAWRARFQRECAPLGPATGDRLAAGISAHSTYSVFPKALAAAAAFAQRQHLPLAIHLAESPEENEMLRFGSGMLADFLCELSGEDPMADLIAGPSPIARAEAAGALGPHTLAIHANLPQPREAGLLAARDAAVVFCPRSHAFFGYPPYPLAACRAARVRLALGTDSLASNDSLDMREEVRLFASLAADWSPREILATASGAALGERPPFGGRGRLSPWLPAQWALWHAAEPAAHPSEEALFALWLAASTTLAASSAM